jgi:hypothetical protein
MPNKSSPKMTSRQKLILSVLLFFAVLVVGILVMLATGRMVLSI